MGINPCTLRCNIICHGVIILELTSRLLISLKCIDSLLKGLSYACQKFPA